jgi:hypothetical protein
VVWPGPGLPGWGVLNLVRLAYVSDGTLGDQAVGASWLLNQVGRPALADSRVRAD